MRTLASVFLFAAVASGQTENREFVLTNTTSSREFREMAYAVSTLANVPLPAVNEGMKTLVVSGTAGQLALADWLIQQLDIDPAAQRPAIQRYPVPGAADDVVCVFYVPNHTAQQLQEIVNAVRTMSDI